MLDLFCVYTLVYASMYLPHIPVNNSMVFAVTRKYIHQRNCPLFQPHKASHISTWHFWTMSQVYSLQWFLNISYLISTFDCHLNLIAMWASLIFIFNNYSFYIKICHWTLLSCFLSSPFCFSSSSFLIFFRTCELLLCS